MKGIGVAFFWAVVLLLILGFIGCWDVRCATRRHATVQPGRVSDEVITSAARSVVVHSSGSRSLCRRRHLMAGPGAARFVESRQDGNRRHGSHRHWPDTAADS